jgi:hypothetical protein
MTIKRIRIIGGGLAGPEAALQAAKRGCQVDLYEMRPTRSTEAHQTSDFAELVCSNSLKSESENSAPWLLKQEMRRAGSILLAEADATAVPAGHAYFPSIPGMALTMLIIPPAQTTLFSCPAVYLFTFLRWKIIPFNEHGTTTTI